MSGNEVLLSIVVPTRDRTRYAADLIRNLHASTSDDFELVIRENSRRSELGELIASLGDPRIRHDYSADDLNMHQNFDEAIALAKGTFVCALGDDDGILIEKAVSVLRRARDEELDAVLTQTLIYNWPGLRHRFWGDVGGCMAGEMFKEKAERVLVPAKERDRVFESGVTGGLGLLPRVYQGFVSRRSLDALRARCGTCFPAASPDMANGVGLVPFVGRMLYSPDAAIISGHSPKSGGGAGAAGRHHGRLEDQTSLPPGTLETWDPAIPRFWSGVTIYAQSAIAAASASTASLAMPMAYHRLYAASLIYEPRVYWPDVFKASRTAPMSTPILAVHVTAAAFEMLVKRTITFLSNIVNVGIAKRGRRHQTLTDAIAALSGDQE